jgi:hypothetical protein
MSRLVSLIAVSAVVRATDADELQRMAADRAARPALARVVRVDRLRPCILGHRGDHAREILAVEGTEGALTVGQHGDLDRRAGGDLPRRARRRRKRSCGHDHRNDCGSGEGKRQLPASPHEVTHVVPSSFVSGACTTYI